jgi:hypothetical protein
MGQAGREGVSSCDVISELSGREGLKINFVKSGMKNELLHFNFALINKTENFYKP